MTLHSSRAAVALAMTCAAALHAQARTAPPTKDSAQIVYDDDGLRIHSKDGTKQLKIRGYFAADVRTVLNDTNDASTNGIAMRRARVIFDATLNSRVAMRVMYDVAAPSGPSPIQDAYVDVGLGGTWWLRAGKQKTPVGLERYMSISSQILPERSLASNMEAGRDLGFLLTGSVADEALDLSLGVFNGAADGGATQDTDPNDDKDITYRVWWKPIRKKVRGAEQGFGLAFDGSTGIEKSPSAAGAKLPTYKTPAQINFFSYAEASGVKAAGRHSRNNIFGYFHHGAALRRSSTPCEGHAAGPAADGMAPPQGQSLQLGAPIVHELLRALIRSVGCQSCFPWTLDVQQSRLTSKEIDVDF